MDIDPDVARALGWPKLKYAWVERERRWLCDHIPDALVLRAERIVDLYITGSRLRLREATPLDGGETMRRLGRKADVSADTRLLTSIYLDEAEFALLAGLPGRRLVKVRHHLTPVDGVAMSIDRFEGGLDGLILAEAEFDDAPSMAAFTGPPFALREVTEDPRYGGGALVANGLPEVG